MSGPLLYNPTRAGLDELDAMLVGRRPLVDKLVTDLVADAGKATKRHWQLVGPRGSGKSHITQLLALRLEQQGWVVARLSEEQYRVNSLGDLLEQILIRLEDADESPLADVDAGDLEERAIDRIRAWRKEHGKPIAVVVENLRLLFERKIRDRRDQARLRGLLGRDAPFVVVATATSFFEGTTHHDAPFYDFFQTVVLDDLSVDEVADLILARARWDREQNLLAQSERLRRRVRAMYHFSGGNPRLVMALYGVLRGGVTDELYQELLALLDAVTPYYQARLQDVSPQSERVLAEMALAGKRLTPSAIAKRCRMPTNQVTALVSKLEAERFIAPTGRPDGRSRYYDLTDRLFRIWMQMREDRAARTRLRFLADFFQRWYAGRPAEVDAAMQKTSTLLWTDVHEAATNKIRERLRTLDYLRASVPDRGTLMALHHLDALRVPATTSEATRWLECLAPLLVDSDPFVRSVAGLLTWTARVILGREPTGKLFAISRESEDVDVVVVAFLWMTSADPGWVATLVAESSHSPRAREYLRLRGGALIFSVGLAARRRRGDESGAATDARESNDRLSPWFQTGAVEWVRERPQRGPELLEFYRWAREHGLLTTELPIYAAALAARAQGRQSQHLSPELGDAVELLLGRWDGEGAASATDSVRMKAESVGPYQVDAAGTASIAADGKAPKGRRGKLRA